MSSKNYKGKLLWPCAHGPASDAPGGVPCGVPRWAGGRRSHCSLHGARWQPASTWVPPCGPRLHLNTHCFNTMRGPTCGGERRILQPWGWGGGPLRHLRRRRADGVYYGRMRVIRPATPPGAHALMSMFLLDKGSNLSCDGHHRFFDGLVIF